MVQELLQKLFFFKSEPKIQDGYVEVQIADNNLADQFQQIELFPKIIFETRSGEIFYGLGISSYAPNDFFKFYLKEYNWNPYLPEKTFSLPETLCPQIQIVKSNDTVKLRWVSSLTQIHFKNQMTSTFPLFLKLQTEPAFHDWLYMFQNVTWDVLNKYVPARRCTIELSDPLDSYAFFLKVRKPNHYNFLIQKSKEESFLGSSPERLLKVQNDLLETEAVAGTRAKEKSEELLNSQKDLKEHDWVVQDILRKLDLLCSSSITKTNPYLYESKNLCHLKTDITAQFSYDPQQLPSLVARLSPTAAICGHPQELALQTLQRYEKFQRGFYSAPIGYFDSDGSEITVAIRSCYILAKKASLASQSSNTLELYSGVGVVSDSNPNQEWDELDLKIKPYMDLLK